MWATCIEFKQRPMKVSLSTSAKDSSVTFEGSLMMLVSV
jgi:hypothetical protein